MKILDALHVVTAIYVLYITTLNYLHEKISSSRVVLRQAPIRRNAMRGRGDIKKKEPDDGPGLSACLLVKDENHNLVEWIAFHYHTLPLRNLVIAVDPNSQTSPSQILQRWNSSMNIALWHDEDYLLQRFRGKLPWNASDAQHLQRHRMRQSLFLNRCMEHHKREKREWTLLIDADEYLILNAVTEEDTRDHFNDYRGNYKKLHPEDPHSPYTYVPRNGKVVSETEQLIAARARIPPTLGTITVQRFINGEKNNPPWVNRSCVLLPRLQFGSVEEPNNTVLHNDIPSGFNPLNFNTLRFFRHFGKNNREKNRLGKVLVDVSRVTFGDLRGRAASPHNPIPPCGSGKTMALVRVYYSLLRVHHYVGTWEAFHSKSDKRRQGETFAKRSSANTGITYEMQPWLRSFVDEVGYDKAKILLEGAGQVGNWKHPDEIQEMEARRRMR